MIIYMNFCTYNNLYTYIYLFICNQGSEQYYKEALPPKRALVPRVLSELVILKEKQKKEQGGIHNNI